MTIAGIQPIPFGKKVFKEFSGDDVTGMAAELSYRYFLALFPFFIFLAALGGFIANMVDVQDPTQSIMNLFGNALPADARSVLEKQIRGVVNSQSGALLSVGILGSLYAASGAMKALMKALNRAYDVPETRPFWKSTVLALLLTLSAVIGIIGAIILFVITTAWASDIADKAGAGEALTITINVVRWPLIIAMLMLAVSFIYWVAPNIELRFRLINPGAILFVAVWIIASVGFAYYVRNFASYNKTYGTLGGVVVLLVWLYLTNITLLLGAEINAALDSVRDPEGARHRREAVANNAAEKKHPGEHAPPHEESDEREHLVPAGEASRRPAPAAGSRSTRLFAALLFGLIIGLAAAGGRFLPREN